MSTFAFEIMGSVFQEDTLAALSDAGQAAGYSRTELQGLSKELLALNIALWYGHAAVHASADLSARAIDEAFMTGMLASLMRLGVAKEVGWERSARAMQLVGGYVDYWSEQRTRPDNQGRNWPFSFCSHFVARLPFDPSLEPLMLRKRAAAYDFAWQAHARVETEVSKILKNWRLVLE